MSYETCAKHEGEPATNGCMKCAAEFHERRMLDLDNFLAGYFGGDGTRETTVRFLEKFKNEGFVVVDLSEAITLDARASSSAQNSRGGPSRRIR